MITRVPDSILDDYRNFFYAHQHTDRNEQRSLSDPMHLRYSKKPKKLKMVKRYRKGQTTQVMQ